MSKEVNNGKSLHTEKSPTSEWWKSTNEDFQHFLAEEALRFVAELMSEKDVEERKKFALTYTTEFRNKVRASYPDVQPTLSDEALMQVLLLIARKKVDRG